VRSVALDVAEGLKAQNIDIARDVEFMSPTAQKAWGMLQGLAKEADEAPNGQVNLMRVAAY
jgi:hypothetical protein